MINKTKLLQNLRYAIHKKGLKLGDVEKTAGVSKGYLSRQDPNNTQVLPTLQFMDSVSDQVGVSIQDLLYSDLMEITKDQQMGIDLAHELFALTRKDELEWTDLFKAREKDKFENPSSLLKRRESADGVKDRFHSQYVFRPALKEWPASFANEAYSCQYNGKNMYLVDLAIWNEHSQRLDNRIALFEKTDSSFEICSTAAGNDIPKFKQSGEAQLYNALLELKYAVKKEQFESLSKIDGIDRLSVLNKHIDEMTKFVFPNVPDSETEGLRNVLKNMFDTLSNHFQNLSEEDDKEMLTLLMEKLDESLSKSEDD